MVISNKGILLDLERFVIDGKSIEVKKTVDGLIVENNLENLCIAANILVVNGYLNHAKRLNMVSLKIDSESIPGLVTQGTIARLEQDFNLAEECYKKAIEHDSDCKSAWYNLGVLSEIQGQPRAAIKYYKKINKTDINSQVRIVICYQKQELHEEAIAHVKKILELSPNNPRALYLLAQSLQQLKKLNQALDTLEALLLVDPSNIDAQYSLGTVYAEKMQNNLAIASFLQVLKLRPEHHEALHSLASIYYFQKEYRKALDCWLKQLVVQSDNYTNYNIGSCYLALQLNDEALPYLRSACEDLPDSIAPLINLASIFIKLEQWQEVVVLYRQALVIEPNNDEVKYVLAAIEQTDNNYLKAPPEYIRHLFDQYADNFESHLLKNLKYCAHIIIHDSLLEHIMPDNKYVIADLGCGTGLCGKQCQAFAKRLIGVDLSPQMLDQASKLSIYDQLIEQDIESFLGENSGLDIILAADVMPYIGDLSTSLIRAFNALNKGGIFVFTTESTYRQQDYYLSESGRYQHNCELLSKLIKNMGWEILESNNVVTRTQNFQPVTSRLFLLKKP